MPLTTQDLAEMYDRCADELFAFFVQRTFSPDVAVELLGETFAASCAARGQCHATDDHAARAWLYGIARNQVADYFRRGRVERDALVKLGVDVAPLSDDEYDRIEDAASSRRLYDVTRDELNALSDDQRQAVTMRIVQELPYADIAERLAVSEQVIRARVSRALRTMRSSSRLLDARKTGSHV